MNEFKDRKHFVVITKTVDYYLYVLSMYNDTAALLHANPFCKTTINLNQTTLIKL